MVECLLVGPPIEGEIVSDKVNPVTKRIRERERYTQIRSWLIIAGLLMVVALMLMFVLFSAARPAQFSIVASVLLCVFTLVPCIVGTLLILVINTALVMGLGYVNKGVPRLFKGIQDGVSRLETSVTSIMRVLAGLVIKLNGQFERWVYMAKGLLRLGRASDLPKVQQQEEKT